MITTKMLNGQEGKTSSNEIKVRRRSHPNTPIMVSTALASLHKRRGISLYAVKKFIIKNYTRDYVTRRMANLIKAYLKELISAGKVIVIKGMGLNGSFRYAKKPKEKVAKATVKREISAKKQKIQKTQPKVNESAPGPAPAPAPAKKKMIRRMKKKRPMRIRVSSESEGGDYLGLLKKFEDQRSRYELSPFY